jgi:hypothetical protein
MQTTIQSLQSISQQVGMLLMVIATALGILELPDHPSRRLVIPSHSVFAYVSNIADQKENPLRREKEESAPHYISYSVAQRTPGRTGRY